MSIQDYLLEKKREQERKIRWEIAKRKTEGTRKVALGALIGTAAGMIAGVLLAPKSGEETRKDIREAAEDATRNMKANVNDTIDTIKYKTDELGYDIKDKYHDFQDRNMTRIKKLQDDDDYDEEEVTYNEDGTICLDGNRTQSYVPDESFETVGDSAACLDDVEEQARKNMEKVGAGSKKEVNTPGSKNKDEDKIYKAHGEPPLSEASSTDTIDDSFETTGDSAACLDDVEKKAKENMKAVENASKKNKK